MIGWVSRQVRTREAFDRTRLFGYIGNSTALLADAGYI
jgi:hypothetical protein